MSVAASTAIGIGIAAGTAGAGVYATHKSSESNDQASALQNKSTEEALADARAQRAYQQQQYGSYLQRLQPYSDQGMSAGRSLADFVARSPYAQPGPTQPQQFTLPQSSIGRLIAKS